MSRALAITTLLLATSLPRAAAAAPCDGVVVTVDNDDPGSGYGEEQPENFQSHDVDACAGTYRYLSQYVGDGSTDGKAIWTPNITVDGTYRVTTSFRASANRTDDADYTLVGDDGSEHTVVVDQRGDGCVHVELGEIWCVVGGSCRLVLDGTDDAKSDAADETSFELVDCEPPPPSPCDPIAAAGFEVCASAPMHCEGVFSQGEGCVALCAAAGMDCVARYGGEPGCSQEATRIPCDEVNDHQSDYCVCEGGPAGTSTGSSGEGGGSSGGVVDASSSGGSLDDGTGAPEPAASSSSGSGVGSSDGGSAGVLPGGTSRGATAGCGCDYGRDGGGAVVVLLSLLAWPRRSRR
jgi:hypothetical protein